MFSPVVGGCQDTTRLPESQRALFPQRRVSPQHPATVVFHILYRLQGSVSVLKSKALSLSFPKTNPNLSFKTGDAVTDGRGDKGVAPGLADSSLLGGDLSGKGRNLLLTCFLIMGAALFSLGSISESLLIHSQANTLNLTLSGCACLLSLLPVAYIMNLF